MSADSTFRCPVCRASQTLRDVCRRCQADLRLVVRARLRLEYVQCQQAAAASSGDQERAQQFASEEDWLAPRGEKFPREVQARTD